MRNNLLVRSLLVASLSLAGTSLVAFEADATSGFLKIKGKTGDIKGGVTQKGQEGNLRILAVTHTIVSPRDAASGLATGKRQHKPFIVTVEVDRAMPLLFRAIATNEPLPSVVMPFPVSDPKTGKDTFYEIKLTNAVISSITLNTKDGKDTLEISFVYQKIEWAWPNGTETSDELGNK